ncbi:hypothetical protein OIU79_000271 [Salix purpurea]|uniref:Uncharacterized protein n=1 Tax=Salix purpurea TaxID=77065 RepID=A0A9Q0V2L5_SALPP|nr:hypothetical protein OIU79_000271 [Salix purpurea]
MELVCRSFRQERGPSINSGRSSSSLLISESISAECARIAGYDRLSASMRMRNEPDIGYRSRKSREKYPAIVRQSNPEIRWRERGEAGRRKGLHGFLILKGDGLCRGGDLLSKSRS